MTIQVWSKGTDDDPSSLQSSESLDGPGNPRVSDVWDGDLSFSIV